jgi:predicted Zn-dependent protease
MELADTLAGPMLKCILVQFRQSRQITQIPHGRSRPQASSMDKIAGLKEILALDAKNSFARYGLAMELASCGDTDAALGEFDALLSNDPNYTAGYFMSAQTLAAAGRTGEAIARLRDGISSAERGGNRHAVSEMQAMLDELDRSS